MYNENYIVNDVFGNSVTISKTEITSCLIENCVPLLGIPIKTILSIRKELQLLGLNPYELKPEDAPGIFKNLKE